MAGKARRNGINGLSAGMWVYAVVPCFDYVCRDVRPAYLWLYLLFEMNHWKKSLKKPLNLNLNETYMKVINKKYKIN